MAFQFLCPQGHVLQGDESQAGQQCMCPYCNSMFLVPQPAGAPAAEAPQAETQEEPQPTPPPGLFDQGGAAPQYDPAPAAESHQPDFGPATAEAPQPESFTGVRPGGGFDFLGGGASTASQEGGVDVTGRTAPIVHVLCPSGHELETPRDMLGQDAMCPYCQVQFRLRFEDSVEYRQQKAEEEELRLSRSAKAWLHWSIAAAAVVLVGVVILAAIAAQH